jgi:hypothetical protein
MKAYPQFPEDWKDNKQTLYRNFHLRSTPDIECLKRLVKEGLSNKGNEGVLRARLLEILRSYFERANARFWTRHYHPYTWRIILTWRYSNRWFKRTFNTRGFRKDVQMCDIASSVMDEILAEEKGEPV